MDFKTIIYQPGRIARVILNRPEKLNAQNFMMLQEMDWAFRAATEDPECRVIILSGNGRISLRVTIFHRRNSRKTLRGWQVISLRTIAVC